MSLQHFGKATLRVAKNYTKGYSDVQAKVREATSNDPWGPSGSQMNEIAQMTYNQNDFVEIMEMLDKRLNDKGKNWRHVFKALTVLDYCLHAGSENVVLYFKDNLYIIKTLKEFQYIDEYDKDQGANVRQKAKDITILLQDEARLREARRNRASMRDRMLNRDNDEDSRDEPSPSASRRPQPKRNNREDDELRRAIEASKQSFNQETAKQAEERDLAAALKLSQEEEEARKKAAEDANAKSLFDDNPSQNKNSNYSSPLINFDGAQSNQLQPQLLQPQATSFNPYWQQQQQQAEQEAMQAEWFRQQQQQQRQLWVQQQQELQAQQLQQQQLQTQQEEWLRQQQLQQQQQQEWIQQQLQQQQQQEWMQQQLLQQQQQQQQQSLATGFGQNNPFAPTQPQQPQAPTPSTRPPIPVQPPSTSPAPTKKLDDGEHSHLANLLANRAEDGIDTFGNIGNLRYGHTHAARLATQNTGNPFSRQQEASIAQQQQNEQPFFAI